MPGDGNAPFDSLNGSVTVEFEFNEQLRGLLDVATVALGPGMPPAKATEAPLAVRALPALIDRRMPPDLQAKDPRVVAGREQYLVSLNPRDPRFPSGPINQ